MNLLQSRAGWTFFLAITCASCSHGGRQGAQQLQQTAELAPEEKLGVDDVFEVRVLAEPELTGAFRVSADGTVDFPLAGRLNVLGMRSGDVQEVITKKLRDGYIRDPQVSVMVKEWNSRKISVLGQVQRPGPVAYFPRMTIVDAIAAAGGFTGLAAKNSVTLRREVKDGQIQRSSFPVADISEGRQPNVVVLPGDVVVVDERLF
jgi:protein involved in polysaccharide export with SLBB domain